MNRLDLVYAPALSPVFGATGLDSGILERLAERAGLPGSIAEAPKGFVPLYATEFFLELVLRETGEGNFLFQSLALDPAERSQTQSVVGVPLPSGITGTEALSAMVQSFNGFISGARYSCVIKGKHVWVLRTAAATEWSDFWSVLQYNLAIMLSGARRSMGAALLPVALRLPLALAALDLPEDMRDLPVVLDRAHFGIAFDLGEVLCADSGAHTPGGQDRSAAANPISDRFLETLELCMREFVTSTPGDCSARRVAAAFGLSERSYRRKLATIGTSHASLLSNTRLDMARRMLAGRSANITAVAFELGYANPGDFTRFFKGRMGCTPQEYRRLRG
ncbi:helix-turn-helix transcriptional regulator [Ruegeria marina]|uniref:AraC-type DNA-binding protein n=1 Tax=Ruegeria marina TaxID=639004 RepID=A0A1G7AVL2_9RHOB|nr:AraC family transcriptional regulator [Ruegeria marina]SDE17986.1 AraC-type DNA-binding protein [Ruegeria marina]